MASEKITRVFIILVFIIFGSIHAYPIFDDTELEIRILHTNDMHARFEETSKYSSTCSKKVSRKGKCYGGFARLATLIRQARNFSPNTLFLNAGDTYQGTIWFSTYKWKIVSEFLNILSPDAISLGNHEFDNGVSGLIPFINNSKFPIVTANLDLSQEPTLRSTKLLNSTILEVKGTKVGVIGYLTPSTKNLASTDNVIFLDEIETIQTEANKLKSQGVNILIALGHSGYEMDKRIAKEVKDIDLVIGGHTNTFLYNGEKPDIENPEGFYPSEIVQNSGRKVYVVQAYAYTKYLGDLVVKFDKTGEITFIEGNPILVDGSIEQAKDVLDELDKWRPEIEKTKHEKVGVTNVFLNGDSKSCRREECNLGNLITDAMIQYNSKEHDQRNGWTDAAIALLPAGSIRKSISIEDNNMIISRADVKEVFPFLDILVKTNLTGEIITEILEFSVKDLIFNNTYDMSGAFLQVSGIQVMYDLSKPYKSKVVSVKVRCAACEIPKYEDIDKEAVYTVLMIDYMKSGGDNYEMLKELKYINLGIEMDQVIVNYLQKESPVNPKIEGRIVYNTPEKS